MEGKKEGREVEEAKASTCGPPARRAHEPEADPACHSYLSPQELDVAASLLAHHYASPEGGAIPLRAKGDNSTKLTAALLAPSGFDLIIAELALLRMGYCVL